MSYVCKLIDGTEISVASSVANDFVRIGEYVVTMEDFCGMARAIIGADIFPWAGETPEPVNKVLSHLFFERYQYVNDKWVRQTLPADEPVTPSDETEDKTGYDV